MNVIGNRIILKKNDWQDVLVEPKRIDIEARCLLLIFNETRQESSQENVLLFKYSTLSLPWICH